MSVLPIISDIWEWIRVDIVGSDIFAGILIAGYVFVLYSSLDLPVPQAVGLSVPTIVVVVLLGYLGWFGWLAIILLGLLFGLLVYKMFGVR